jgi:hypothetical protein
MRLGQRAHALLILSIGWRRSINERVNPKLQLTQFG